MHSRRQLFNTFIPRLLMDRSVAYTVVQLVTLDCSSGAIDSLYHCRRSARHRQYKHSCRITCDISCCIVVMFNVMLSVTWTEWRQHIGCLPHTLTMLCSLHCSDIVTYLLCRCFSHHMSSVLMWWSKLPHGRLWIRWVVFHVSFLACTQAAWASHFIASHLILLFIFYMCCAVQVSKD